MYFKRSIFIEWNNFWYLKGMSYLYMYNVYEFIVYVNFKYCVNWKKMIIKDKVSYILCVCIKCLEEENL